MFDSWIQRQSAINANKENRLSQPMKTVKEPLKPPQPQKFMFNSKNKQGMESGRRRKEVQKPAINFRNIENIGSNIKMIKSNTYEN